MASYAYPKASTLATRTLISSDKPTETPSSASHDHEDAHDRPVFQRTPTNNYAEAVAASGQTPTTSTAPIDEIGRPGLDRKQSWKMQDLKREQHEQIINSAGKGQGYKSTTQ